ncbi:tyrosine kinase, putative [Entamoeba histolytica]
MFLLFFIFIFSSLSEDYGVCSPGFAISSPSYYISKLSGTFTTPYFCAEMNLRATGIAESAKAFIVGFSNFGLVYSNENNTSKVSLLYYNSEQKVETLFSPSYFEWNDVCLSASEDNLISVYINGKKQTTTYQASEIIKENDNIFMLCTSSQIYNIGTVSGFIYGSHVLTEEEVIYYHTKHISPSNVIFKQKARLSYTSGNAVFFNNLLFYGGTKVSGGISNLKTSIGIPLIDDGCYDGALEKLAMRRTDLIPDITINKQNLATLTFVEISDMKTHDSYFLFNNGGSITINTLDTNVKRFVRLELDVQGNFIVQYQMNNQWYNGVNIKANYFTPNYVLYLPYYLLGSQVTLRIITTSIPSSEINLSLDPLIKEIRIHYGTCNGHNGMFCAIDNSFGICSSNECSPKAKLSTKTFDFNNYNIPSSVSSIILKSKENNNVFLTTYQIKNSLIGEGSDTILDTPNSKYFKFTQSEVSFLEVSSYDIPSGWGKYTNEYTYLVTVKIENSTTSLFKTSFFGFTMQTLNINLYKGKPTLSILTALETKEIPINKWVKIGLTVNSTSLTMACDGRIVLRAKNEQYVDYLSSTAFKFEAVRMYGNSFASIQEYPIAVTDNVLNTLTITGLTIDNTCSTTLPNICINKKPYSPFEKSCPINCIECQNGICQECMNNFDLSTGCTKCKEKYSGELCNECASGYKGYPECKSYTTSIIIISVIGGIFLIIVFIVVIIIIILLLRRRKIKQEKEMEEDEMKALENNGTAQLLKNARKKKVVVGTETLIELGNNIYINKAHLDFNLDGAEPDIDTPLLDTLLIKNHTDKQFVIWIQVPKKDKFFLQADVEKEILEPRVEMNVHFEIQLHCNCSCKEKIIIRIEDTKTKEGETGTIALAVSTYKSNKIDFDEIELKQPPLGDGAFGVVYRGTYRGIEVAVKKLKERTDNIGAKQEFDKEVTLMTRLRGPYIVGFIGACYLEKKMCIAIEFAPDGSLGHVLKKVKLSYEQKLKFMIDCCKGMAMMHSINIIHRDLKPDNLLMFCVDQVNPKIVNCKITDFGTSRAVQEYEGNYTCGVGTPVYMAPELLSKEPYTITADQFSFAIMMYEVYIQGKPYSSEQFKMPWDIAKFVIAGKRLERKDTMTDVWWNVITQCWDHIPSKRPAFKDVAVMLQDELATLIPTFAENKEVTSPQKLREESIDPNMKTTTTTTTLTSTMNSDVGYNTNQTGMSKFINTTTDDFEVN